MIISFFKADSEMGGVTSTIPEHGEKGGWWVGGGCVGDGWLVESAEASWPQGV